MKITLWILSALTILGFRLLIAPILRAEEHQINQTQPEAEKKDAAVPRADAASSQKTDWLDIAIEHRTRYETLDNRYRLGEAGSDQQIAQRTRIRFGIKKLVGPIGFLLEFQDSRVHLNDSGSTILNTHVNENDILQLRVNVAFKWPGKTSLPSMLYLGRQSFDLGNRRLFARNRFRNTTNSFDGIRWTLGDEKQWLLSAFVFQPVTIRMHQLDSRNRGLFFYGAYLNLNNFSKFKSELYYFGTRETQANLQYQKYRFSTLGGRLYRDPEVGEVSYEFEAACQFGKIDALSQLAHFEHVSADYSIKTPWRPKITVQYDYASGDRDPDDHKSGTFIPLFGARRFEFGPTGIYGVIYRANLSTPGWVLEINPTKKLMLSPAMRWFWLAQARDRWVGSGLRDVTGRSGTYLGSQLELRLRYNFMNYFQPEMGYVRFFKGSYAKQAPNSPTTADSNYFYLEANFTFDHLLK